LFEGGLGIGEEIFILNRSYTLVLRNDIVNGRRDKGWTEQFQTQSNLFFVIKRRDSVRRDKEGETEEGETGRRNK